MKIRAALAGNGLMTSPLGERTFGRVATRHVVVFALAAAVAGCRPHASASLTPGPVATLAIAGSANSGASVSAANGRVVVTWTATQGDQAVLYAAVSRDDGATFGAPVQVNDLAGDVRVSGDQAPRVTIGDKGEMSVIWTSKLNGATRIRIGRSTDDGRTFLPATTLSGDSLTGIRGWASIAQTPGGTMHAAWLDGRDAPPHVMTPGMTMHAGGHTMRQDLFQAVWTGTGSVHETRIATNTCFCCKTGVAVGPDGATYVAWRHVYPTNLRDMAVAASFDGGQTFGEPVRVSEDHWQIDACPEDGPAIAADANGTVHIAWPTLVDGETPHKGVFYSTSVDRGRTFSPRTLLNVGKPLLNAAHVQMASLNDTLAIAWDEDGAEGQRVHVRVGPTRAVQGLHQPIVISLGAGPVNMRPTLALTPSAVMVAWTAQTGDVSEVRVQRIAR